MSHRIINSSWGALPCTVSISFHQLIVIEIVWMCPKHDSKALIYIKLGQETTICIGGLQITCEEYGNWQWAENEQKIPLPCPMHIGSIFFLTSVCFCESDYVHFCF